MAFVTINTYQLFVLWRESQPIEFEKEAKILYENVFQLLNPSEFQRLIKLGCFESLPAGKTIIVRDYSVESIYVVTSGELAVKLNGITLNCLRAGDFAGEMSYLTGHPACADVVVSQDARIFRISETEIAQLKTNQPDIYNKLTAILGRNLAEKLHGVNKSIEIRPAAQTISSCLR